MAPVPCDDHEMHRMSLLIKRRYASSRRQASVLVPLAGLLLASAGLLTAQATNPPGTVWDGVYTEAQAARGVMSFAQSCARCHVLEAEGRAPLAGEHFWKSFAQTTVGDLLEFVSANMPNGAPRSLTESTYSDIVALMLKSNGFPAGMVELGRTASAKVQIIRKDGSTELPANALVRVVGCLAKGAEDWQVIKATTPVRAESPSGEDATKPLGSGTMALKFVLTRLDPLAGSRVAVTGLLIGAGGVEGINVTGVTRVGPKCP
jgi:mono/diheme cytochrome c family protein